MKKLLAAAVAVSAASMGWSASASALETQAKAAVVDFRACDFRSGKNMGDLEKVNAKFREYANKNDFDYAAWALTPQYHNNADFDIGWLGAWPNGGAYGVSMEKWATTGRGLAAQFDEVIDCSERHELALSLPINSPEGTPEDGVLMFYQCSLQEGKTLANAYKSHLEAGAAMKAKGSLAASWMFQPAMGAGAINFDYYHVVGFYRYSDLGATMEMYANGGGRQVQQKILGSVSTCETPVVFDALSVRARDER